MGFSFTLDGQRQPGQLTKMFLKMFLILLTSTLLHLSNQKPNFPCDNYMAYRCKSRYSPAYFTTGANSMTYDNVRSGAWACTRCCSRNDFEGLKCQCDAINDRQTFWSCNRKRGVLE